MNNLDLVTIVIPVRNEATNIQNLLNSIFQQMNLDNHFEIIIADGISTDGTREIINSVINSDKSRLIRLIDNPTVIVSTGLNEAIKKSIGNVIIRIDGHTSLSEDYIFSCIQLLKKTNADNVGGRMVAIGNTPFGKTVAIGTSTSFGIGGSKFHYSDKEEWVDSVYMGAWPREVFEKYGLFDEELVRDQDDEFNYRIRENGGKILLSPLIKSEYTVRSTASSLWKQYYQYGFWKVRVLQKHPRQMSLRQFVPPTFVFSLLASLPLSLVTVWGWIVLILIAGSYLIANLAASIFTARNKGWEHLSRLPFVFAILHLSYGSGFLVGLVKFWNRWGDKVGKVPPFHPQAN